MLPLNTPCHKPQHRYVWAHVLTDTQSLVLPMFWANFITSGVRFDQKVYLLTNPLPISISNLHLFDLPVYVNVQETICSYLNTLLSHRKKVVVSGLEGFLHFYSIKLQNNFMLLFSLIEHILLTLSLGTLEEDRSHLFWIISPSFPKYSQIVLELFSRKIKYISSNCPNTACTVCF